MCMCKFGTHTLAIKCHSRKIERIQRGPGTSSSCASFELSLCRIVTRSVSRVSIGSGEKQAMTVHEELEDFELAVEQLEEANRLA
jgi:hypothetical protein